MKKLFFNILSLTGKIIKNFLDFITKISFKNLVLPFIKGFLRIFFSDVKVAFIIRTAGYFIGVFKFLSLIFSFSVILNLYTFDGGFSFQNVIDFLYAYFQTFIENIEMTIDRYYNRGNINYGGTSTSSKIFDRVNLRNDKDPTKFWGSEPHKEFVKETIYDKITRKINNNIVDPIIDNTLSFWQTWEFWLGMFLLAFFFGIIFTDNPIKSSVKASVSSDDDKPGFIYTYIIKPIKSLFSEVKEAHKDNVLPNTPIDDTVSHPATPSSEFKRNYFQHFYDFITRKKSNDVLNLPLAPSDTPWTPSNSITKVKEHYNYWFNSSASPLIKKISPKRAKMLESQELSRAQEFLNRENSSELLAKMDNLKNSDKATEAEKRLSVLKDLQAFKHDDNNENILAEIEVHRLAFDVN